MNSYLRTPKLTKFNELIDILNKKRDLNIIKYSVQTQDFSKDAWLAGFVDADGSFGIVYTKKEVNVSGKTTKKRKVACRLRIEQRMVDPNTMESYEPILKSIANFLGVNLVVVTRNTGNQYFNVTAKSRKSLSIIKDYFNTYPLLSSKYLDYKDFEVVVDFILQQTHYDDVNSTKIEDLRDGMNNGRIKFSWNHLDWLGINTGPLNKICNKFNNKLNKSNIRNYSTKIDKNDLGPYLAGLYEGDGHIWIQKTFSGKNHNPRFCITFGLKNEPLAKKLLEIIGSGFIRYKKSDNACVLVISSVAGLKKVVCLINGNVRTPKIGQLQALINWLNKNHNSNILILSICDSPIFSNAWLSGFIDADGSFSVQYTKKENANKRKISCRLRIEQRMIDPSSNNSYYDILNKIATFLLCNLLTRVQNSTGNQYYTLTASSLESLKVIINYFTKYPLYSSKYLDYKDWEIIAKLRLNNEHYTENGISKVELAKNSMNNSRTFFNWDHLKNFSNK